ncbi:HAMP domain-containing protein [Paenibacillus sp. LMG 31461]|uniref:HAMP domain-containing protein n=1 Tax=Paenibacillus plantarum TaxID=2654975 RepID=A0ABX1XLJ5_9BACL|nr:histidine kinase [Paenibacillus plantarum]NOU69420.1 HAMP domain-containing protein [Paenibacillus plantarum]
MRFPNKFQQSIQLKITTIFLCILIPLVCVSLFSNQMSQRILKQQISDRVQASIHSSVGYLDLVVSNLGQMSYLVSTDKGIIEVISHFTQEISTENLYELHGVQQQLTTLLNVNRSVQEISMLSGRTGNMLSSEAGIVHFDNVYEQAWYKDAIRENGGMIVYVPSNQVVREQKYWKKDRIYFIRVMDPYNLNNSDKDLVITAINQASLFAIVKPLITSTSTEMGLYYKGSMVLFQYAEEPANETELLTMTSGTMAGGWELTIKLQEAEILAANYQIRNFTYVIMAMSIVLALGMSFFVYNAIAKPLFRLTAQMRQFSIGNLKAYVQHRRKDELGYVMDSFNTMVSKQKQLIEDGYEKELRLAKSQFRLLQSQINPHFLYNTLDCMYSISEEHEVHEVSEMVMNLAKFFRVSLGKGRDQFTMEETIEHLMYYIRVQQMRLVDRFTVTVEMEPEAKSIQLLRLLLQPLIENAIVHGLENIAHQGSLAIRISIVEPHMLQIVIADTGIGLQETILQELTKQLDRIEGDHVHLLINEDDSVTSQFFALKNVKSRMKLFYGAESQLMIASTWGEGATVTMLLPIQQEF